MIAAQEPSLYEGLHVAYAVLLFTRTYVACSVLLSLADVFIASPRTAGKAVALPAYPPPQMREALFLVVDALAAFIPTSHRIVIMLLKSTEL
jgi:ABC-type phosphate transport system permease subunit